MLSSTLILSPFWLLAGFGAASVVPVDTVEFAEARFVTQTLAFELAAVATGDFDGDGHQDVVAAGESRLTIYRGDGKGGLEPYSTVPGGDNPVDFAIADLNSDGHLDIVVANHETDHVTLLLGTGTGGFEPAPNSPLTIDVGPHPHAVRARDLDGDGHADLVVDHREAEGLLILAGQGHARFETPGLVVRGGGDPYRGMAIGDINGDGKEDIVTPNPREVGVLINRSQDALSFSRGNSVPAQAPFGVELSDLNGDGMLDVIAGSDQGSSLVEVYWGDGNGAFEEADDSPIRFAPGAKVIATGDFNGDAIQDVAVASYMSDTVLVLTWNGSLNATFVQGGEHPWGLAAADLNEDGRDDLLIVDDADGTARIYLSIE